MFKNIDKNTVLGIFLIVLMVGLYTWNLSKKAKTMASTPPVSADSTKTNTAKNLDTASATKTLAQTKDTAATPLVSSPNQQFVLENDLVKIEISSNGGGINNVSLKKYTTFENKPVELLNEKNTKWNFTFPTQTGNISTSKESFVLVSNENGNLKLQSASGVILNYSLPKNSYKLSQKWTVPGYAKDKKVNLSIQTEMAQQEANLTRERQYSTIMYLQDGDSYVEKLNLNKNDEKQNEKPFKFLTFSQQFFNVSILPSRNFEKGTMKSFYMENELNYVKKYNADLTLLPQDSLSFEYFIGPSSYKLLKAENNDLHTIIPLSQDIVIFRWVKIFNEYFIIPIFDFLSQFFTNYGVIIFLLTLIVKLLLTPLSFKTFRSGVAMKVLKPELDKLKAKHGDDQQAFAQEQMKMFSEYGVSPLGGCMPMLLQMPILFAMFSFFPAAIELRHEPFLWASDLSTYDNILTLPFTIPFYGNHVSLFALLMTATQIATTVYTQRLQPSSPQADQMKMMSYIMPVIFLFMFNSFPAAITYYYLLQNVMSIFQQWFVTKFFIDENKIRAEIEEHKKKPKKQGMFQQKMQEMMAQAEEQKKMQQKNNKK
jgi:YidC/Oxa1 family membrane protein insertase